MSKTKSRNETLPDEPTPSSSSEISVTSKSIESIDDSLMAADTSVECLWTQPTNVEDKSREDEFDDYLMDLLL